MIGEERNVNNGATGRKREENSALKTFSNLAEVHERAYVEGCSSGSTHEHQRVVSPSD